MQLNYANDILNLTRAESSVDEIFSVQIGLNSTKKKLIEEKTGLISYKVVTTK